MNAKQALKAAAKHIEEMEHYNAKCKADIVAYNRIVLGLIDGSVNPCDWCEENAECERPVKGKGCSEWWLTYTPPDAKEDADESAGVPIVGSEGGV